MKNAHLNLTQELRQCNNFCINNELGLGEYRMLAGEKADYG